MRLTCPSCGAIASVDAFENDAAARQCLKLVVELPAPVAQRVLGYLALFRPSAGRGLAWSKALRLIGELRDEVAQPTIQWKQQVARPNLAAAWGEALERVAACPPARLPLKSHGYLKAIAYEIANEMDKGREKQQVACERSGNYVRRPQVEQEPAQVDFDALRQAIRKGRKSPEGSGM